MARDDAFIHLGGELGYEDRFVTPLRERHPAIRDWSIETFASLDHVLVTVLDSGRGTVDALLEAQGLSRRIALKMPHYYAAIRIVAASDYVVTLPATIAGMLAPEFGLMVLELPFRHPPFEVITIWADVLDRDPASVWLRALVREEARRVAGTVAEPSQKGVPGSHIAPE